MSVLPALAVIASIALMYIVGARVFASVRFGAFTAVAFALTPLIWRQLQSAPASLYPLPFVLGWLVAVTHFAEARASWWAAAAGAALGLGIYTSPAAVVMMPVYLLLTLVVFAVARAAPPRAFAILVGAFSIAAVPFVAWVILHPDDYRRAITAHHLYDAGRFNVLQGAHEMVSWVGLTARSEVFYDYFNPTLLFLTGRVLLFPLAVLLPVGVYRILIRESAPLARLFVCGFFAAPFAASLTAERPTPGRILFITTFAAIVSAYGVRHLLSLWIDSRGPLSVEGRARAQRHAAGRADGAYGTRR